MAATAAAHVPQRTLRLGAPWPDRDASDQPVLTLPPRGLERRSATGTPSST